ncbi:UNVERIFIED_CONTAM: hypothetical protein HDU68_001623 [Siphonaria sp. JEL0065]|nr:hypothetical protein HDU68_001623 [Siphonaria sp. JEL0065]
MHKFLVDAGEKLLMNSPRLKLKLSVLKQKRNEKEAVDEEENNDEQLRGRCDQLQTANARQKTRINRKEKVTRRELLFEIHQFQVQLQESNEQRIEAIHKAEVSDLRVRLRRRDEKESVIAFSITVVLAAVEEANPVDVAVLNTNPRCHVTFTTNDYRSGCAPAFPLVFTNRLRNQGIYEGPVYLFTLEVCSIRKN